MGKEWAHATSTYARQFAGEEAELLLPGPWHTGGYGRCGEDTWFSPSLWWGYGWAQGAAKGMEELGSLKLCGFPRSAGAALVKPLRRPLLYPLVPRSLPQLTAPTVMLIKNRANL